MNKEEVTMLNKVRNQSGFTLIELLIVVIIVAVLAAVGIPLLQGNVERAKLTEADAGLGTLKTAERAYLAEHNTYLLPTADLSELGMKLPATTGTGTDAVTTPGDLDGRFFDTPAYAVASASATAFCVGVDGSLSTAPKGSEVSALKRSMNQDGFIFNDAACAGTQLN